MMDVETAPSKVCSSCGLLKPYTDFGKRASAADGLYYWCKECVSKRNSQPPSGSAQEYDARRIQEAESKVWNALVSKGYRDIKMWWQIGNPDHKVPRALLRWTAWCGVEGHPHRKGTSTTIRYNRNTKDAQCRYCNEKRYYLTPAMAIQRMHSIAADNDARCLSEEKDYQNNRSIMRFICRNGHQMSCVFQDISAGCFCPDIQCMQEKAALSLAKFRAYLRWDTKEIVWARGGYEWAFVEMLNKLKLKDWSWQIPFNIPSSVPVIGGTQYVLDFFGQLPHMTHPKHVEIKGWAGRNECSMPKYEWLRKHVGSDNCEILYLEDLERHGIYWKRHGYRGAYNGRKHGTPEELLLLRTENYEVLPWWKSSTDPAVLKSVHELRARSKRKNRELVWL